MPRSLIDKEDLLSLKERVKNFWEDHPCGARDAVSLPEGSRGFFDLIERLRFEGDDFMQEIAKFDKWSGRKVLEIGCGIGTDLFQFAKGKAEVFGIDLTQKAVRLTRRRFSLYDLTVHLCVGDGENLPFPSDYFDLVYVWGVIHHTSNPRDMIHEIYRVLKPGGSVLSMVYHRYSLVVFQIWIYYGLLGAKPWRSPSELIARYLESPGTKVYSKKEARVLFKDFENLEFRTVVTRYDARVGRRIFLPRFIRRFIPSCLGWFLVINGNKSNCT